MNNDTVSENVRQFFGGYFHQDWDLEAEDWQGAVDQYSHGTSPMKLLALAQEIDTLRKAYDEAELGTVMHHRAWCSYNPRPLTFYDWMGQVADRLRQRAADAEREP